MFTELRQIWQQWDIVMNWMKSAYGDKMLELSISISVSCDQRWMLFQERVYQRWSNNSLY